MSIQTHIIILNWVDINNELPDSNRSVLLCLNVSRFVIMGWFDGYDFVTECFSNYEHGTTKVYPTHWMEKPTPPSL